tara:strand:- start:489 stop:1184 length:696 start_codon:yes stop_codon:yes gene_type:complete
LRILKNLWILAKSGFTQEVEKTFREKVNFLLRLFLVLLIFKIIYFTSTYLIKTIDAINFPVVSTEFEMDTYAGIYQFLILAIFLPIIEELTFRLGLKFTKWNFVIMFTGLTFISLKILFKLGWVTSITIGAVSTIVFSILLKKQILEKLTEFWKNNRLVIFYFLLICFSTLHLSNYELNYSSLLYVPILFLPHFFTGLIFSYARLESGIILSISLHILNNALISFPILLTG